MKRPPQTPEQRAALDRARKPKTVFRAWHGPRPTRHVDAEKVVPKHARLVRS